MEVVEHVINSAVNRACMLTAKQRGPFVRFEKMPPVESYGDWLISESAVVMMAKILGLPSARDVDAVDQENDRLRQKVAALEGEVEQLRFILTAHRRMLGLDELPTLAQFREAEAVVASVEPATEPEVAA